MKQDINNRENSGYVAVTALCSMGLSALLETSCCRQRSASGIIGMALSFPSMHHALTEELRSFLPADRMEHFKDFFTSRVENNWYLDALAVAEPFINSGIGAELIRRSIQRGEKEGFGTISLIAFADNDKALHVYKK